MSKLRTSSHLLVADEMAHDIRSSNNIPSKAEVQPKAEGHPNLLKAVQDVPGKAAESHMLDSHEMGVAIESVITRTKIEAPLQEAGFRSPESIIKIAKLALVRLRADGTMKVTVSDWLSAIFEIHAPKIPRVRRTTGLALASALDFAIEAMEEKRKTFINGFGTIDSLVLPEYGALKRLIQSQHPDELVNTLIREGVIAEIRNLRIGNLKYCDLGYRMKNIATGTDMAEQSIVKANRSLLSLSVEFKTAGVKLAELDVQEAKRNERLVDEGLPSSTLSFFENDILITKSLDEVWLHLENPGNQLGFKAAKTENIDFRFPTLPQSNYTAAYAYDRARFPSREFRVVLQAMFNHLPR